MHQQNEDIQQISEVFHKLKDAEPIPLSIDASAAFLLICQLQLALRHPGNNGDGSVIIRQIATVLEQAIGERVPEAVTQLEKGWHPEFDVKVELTYEDLDINFQEEVLANSFALNYACVALSQVTGEPAERWAKTLAETVACSIGSYSEDEIRSEIKQLLEERQEMLNKL